MKKILAVSAGQEQYKKGNDNYKRKIKYLNYGLLGLATILHEELGIDILVMQADQDTPEEFIKKIESKFGDVKEECECILLSIPSFYSVSWCQRFCTLIKEKYDKKIIVGGRWVVDNNTKWIREKLIYIDDIIEGFGEQKLLSLFANGKQFKAHDGAKDCFKAFNYDLLLDYKKYQPSIEISRGCGSGCKFCADRNNRRIPNKSVAQVISEVADVKKRFGDVSIYFEAPHFIFEKDWVQEFCSAVEKENEFINWRCTTRVESVKIDLIQDLAKTGLKVLDIGLESASPTQLLKMSKTKNPDAYLEKADAILRECKKYGVWVKLNILLYAGETHQTIRETIAWLNERKEYIKYVSVSSVVYYMGAGDVDSMISQGAKIPIGENINDKGYINLDLSEEIDAKEAQALALQISRTVANQKDYYQIKSISYFERGYSYAEFLKDVKACNEESLPFKIELD